MAPPLLLLTYTWGLPLKFIVVLGARNATELNIKEFVRCITNEIAFQNGSVEGGPPTNMIHNHALLLL